MASEAKPPAGGFPVGLTIAVAIALASLLGHGTWPLQRLAWKRDVLERIPTLSGVALAELTPKAWKDARPAAPVV